MRINLRDALELPPGAAQNYSARSPWKSDASRPAIELYAQSVNDFQLAPFEVLTLELTPERAP
jgi:hypothetical protein